MSDTMSRFVAERHVAMVEAIMNDKWDKIKAFAKKYEELIPSDKAVMKAGIYKAAQECADLSDEVKNVAAKKCLEMGFAPFACREEQVPQARSECFRALLNLRNMLGVYNDTWMNSKKKYKTSVLSLLDIILRNPILLDDFMTYGGMPQYMSSKMRVKPSGEVIVEELK